MTGGVPRDRVTDDRCIGIMGNQDAASAVSNRVSCDRVTDDSRGRRLTGDPTPSGHPAANIRPGSPGDRETLYHRTGTLAVNEQYHISGVRIDSVSSIDHGDVWP